MIKDPDRSSLRKFFVLHAEIKYLFKIQRLDEGILRCFFHDINSFPNMRDYINKILLPKEHLADVSDIELLKENFRENFIEKLNFRNKKIEKFFSLYGHLLFGLMSCRIKAKTAKQREFVAFSNYLKKPNDNQPVELHWRKVFLEALESFISIPASLSVQEKIKYAKLREDFTFYCIIRISTGFEIDFEKTKEDFINSDFKTNPFLAKALKDLDVSVHFVNVLKCALFSENRSRYLLHNIHRLIVSRNIGELEVFCDSLNFKTTILVHLISSVEGFRYTSTPIIDGSNYSSSGGMVNNSNTNSGSIDWGSSFDDMGASNWESHHNPYSPQ